MTTTVIINNKPNRHGLHCLFIRVTHQRKHHSKSSEIYVKKADFKKKAKYGHWIINRLDRDELNNVLKRKIVAVERIYQGNQDVTPKAAVMADSFGAFAVNFYKQYNNEHQQGTYRHYDVITTNLLRYAGGSLKFSDITVKFLRDYSTYLKTSGNKVNTVGFKLKKIRAIIRQAVKEDVVEWNKNPFNKIKIESQRTGKEKLNKDELNLIRKADIPENRYEYHARNVFLFCLNCMGMRVGSAIKIKKTQIQNGVLHYQMNKGGKTKNIELTEEAKQIVNYYYTGQFENNEYLFPYMKKGDNVYKKISSTTIMINKAIKRICKRVGITKHVTTHVARHTLTKMAIDAGVGMRDLQGMLDHSSIKTTEDYAGDIADVRGNEALKKIFKV